MSFDGSVRMRLSVLVLITLALAACAPMQPTQARETAAASVADPVRVTVTRDGDDWTADYTFDRDAPVWAFMRSALLRETRQPWRLQQWSVQTLGVVMERQGTRDILRAIDGGPVPRRVRIAMRPAEGDLEAAYDPALIFSDGSVALYSGQFDVFPLVSIQAALALPIDLNGVDLETGPATVTWRDRAGPVLFRGERLPVVTAERAETYVLFGRADRVEGDRLVTVTDPALPDWIGAEIGDFAPRVADYYAARLGPSPMGRPTVMVSWTGPTAGRRSMGGSVLPGLIVMTFEGVGVVERTPEVLAVSRWFIGHESAHFWLGQTVRYEFARDMWITEGGADLMAVRALAAVDPTYDARAELQKEVDDCIDLSRGRGVATAAERGEHRAYYACGAVWAMVAEGALRQGGDGDWLDYLRPLLDANRADEVLTREEWLAQLTRVSRDPSLRLDIERMLDRGVDDPAAVIARLFDRTGVAHRLEAGRVVLG